MSLYREEVAALKVSREDLSVSLQEKVLALDSTQGRCKELQVRLQEAEADKERILGEKSSEDQASCRETEELKKKAAQELSLAR